VASYLAILQIGAIAVPFATASTAEDIRAKQNFVRCKTILRRSALSSQVLGAFEGDLPLIFDDVLKSDAKLQRPANSFDSDPDADVALMFTSGTTGKPRAVRVTAGNIRANTDSIIEYLNLDREQRILVVLPFYYCLAPHCSTPSSCGWLPGFL